MAKQRVVILGGGCASMTAAYYLSNTQALRDALEVTVYQVGWRLGGKGASGRNGLCKRIEEHGLHVWGGFYYNAFRLMRECYTELARPAGCPLRNWEDAFKRHNFVAWEEWINGRWLTWPVHPPVDNDNPGTGNPHPSLLECLARIVGWIADAIENWPNETVGSLARDSGQQAHIQLLRPSTDAINAAGGAFDGSPLSALRSAQAIASSMSAHAESYSYLESSSLSVTLSMFREWFRVVHGGLLDNDFLRRVFIVADLGLTICVGAVADSLPTRGFMSIDGEDFKDWLQRHGALKIALDSPVVRGFYDYFFAYEGGDFNSPRMSAGMGLHHLIRLIGDYKGSLFWKMQSGMGDAVFAPLYELCARNGVKFEFFHRVDKIIPAAGNSSIASIQLKRQVHLKSDPYEPLVAVKDVPSWPSEPRYDQIDPAEAAELQRRNANLEDPWTDWDDVDTIELQAGRDFDAAILGVSIGAFPSICKPIIENNPVWAEMVNMLPAIQTQAMQLWFTQPVNRLGWKGGNATGTGYANPLESWSDMSPVIDVEDWPPGHEPKSVIYFCGPMKNAPMPQTTDPGFGVQQTQAAHDNALAWIRANLAHLYPMFDQGGQLQWDLLFDLGGSNGEARFEAQYVRANYTPSERYVVDLPGTARFRLEADTSGYSNLALAGDWIFTGLGGSVESAVIAGMLAARGLARTITDSIVDEMPNPWRRPVSLVPII